MLFMTVDLIPFIKERKSLVMIPNFCASIAFFADMLMICDSGTRPGQHFSNFLFTYFSTSSISFFGIWSHLLHTNSALFDENSPFSLSVTFLTSLSNFSSCKINKSLILFSINVMVWKLLKDIGQALTYQSPFNGVPHGLINCCHLGMVVILNTDPVFLDSSGVVSFDDINKCESFR